MPPGTCCSTYSKTAAFLALGASLSDFGYFAAEAMSLTRVAQFALRPGTRRLLVVSSGSVVDFEHAGGGPAAIVNAANEMCLGGGGVDGAISDAGGPNLLRDREALPVSKMVGSLEVRCPTGRAVITGPGSYGLLRVPYVIHAVGPNYREYEPNLEEADELLASAYAESLERGREAGLEAVAFSLLSSGIFRGPRSKREVLGIGVRAIADHGGYDELREVHMCAFSTSDVGILLDIAAEEGLKEQKVEEL